MSLARTLAQWRGCDPHAMATRQSPAAVEFALADAKHDILALHATVEGLREVLQEIKNHGLSWDPRYDKLLAP